MFEFEIPEKLISYSDEELSGFMNQAREEFTLLYESDDVSDPILDRMTNLSDCVEEIYSEFVQRSVDKKNVLAVRFSSIFGV